jgi:O-antigen/teichoic acid export membrane protein
MLDKIKSLSKQTLIYGTSTIIGRFLNFILVPFYTNVFPPSEYGVVAIIFAYIAFLNIIYTLGFEAGYFRFASSNEIGTEKQNFSHPFITILCNSSVFSVIILLFSGPISEVVGLTSRSIIIYSAFILFFDALSLVPFAYLRLKNKAKVFALIRLINIFINVALNLVLILVYKMGLEAIFISNLAASIITLLLLTPVIVKNLSLKFNSELFSELRRFSLPYLPAGLASMVVQVIDKPIMQYLTDLKTVGIYNANYKLGIFMMLIVAMFDYAWRPFFLNNAKDPNAKPLFAKVLTIFTGASSLLFIILTFTIDKIIQIPLPMKGYLIGPKYWSGVVIVPTVLFAYVFLGIYVNLLAGIQIQKKSKYMPLISGTGAVLNIAACFILIPAIGIMGGAAATLLSFISMTLCTYIIVQKFYPVTYEYLKVIGVMAVNSAAMVIFYGAWYSHFDLNWYYRAGIIAVMCGAIIYFSELYKAKKLLRKDKISAKPAGNAAEIENEVITTEPEL